MEKRSRVHAGALQFFLVMKLVFMVTIPVVLCSLPADYFDTGESVCLSQMLFELECYGCGMTRACMHFIHLDLAGAYQYNLLSFLAMPVLSLLWMQTFVRSIAKCVKLFSR